MASNTSYAELLDLNAQQKDLLRAALESNQPDRQSSSSRNNYNGASSIMDSGSFQSPPKPHQTPGSSGMDGSLESPFIDYDGDYDNDAGFDFDPNLSLDGEMIGSLPGDDLDQGEKRKSFEGEREDDEGGGKRQETDEKSSRKPGRKPLTSEPTSKRKAQNRAAQRAFRERKEKHLKDLETKVSDLEKASESANHENTLLRSQVDRLTTELSEYRKRLATSITGTSPGGSSYNRNSWHNNGNDFQFDFPTFGSDRFPPASRKSSGNNANSKKSSSSNAQRSSSASRGQNQRASSYGSSTSNSLALNQASLTSSPSPITATEVFGDLFSPSILASVNMSPGSDYLSHNNSLVSQPSPSRVGSIDRHNSGVPQLNGGSTNFSNTASPSASSVSQHGPGSSNETSPEPIANSPTKSGERNLNTIEENNPLSIVDSNNTFMTKTPANEYSGIDWLAQQNGGQFAPDLFGGYRESQDAVVADYSGSFFNDAFPVSEFGSPLNGQDAVSNSTAPKKNLLQEMDKKAEEYPPMAEPGEDMLSMNNVWDHIQKDEKFKTGDCDIEGLCSEMKKKARCTERGLAVKKDDVNELLSKGKAQAQA